MQGDYLTSVVVQTPEGKHKELACGTLVCAHNRSADGNTLRAINACGLVFDGALVVRTLLIDMQPLSLVLVLLRRRSNRISQPMTRTYMREVV
jgi:hypothetical protein